MATGDYMYYSDGHNVWPLGQYQPGVACGYIRVAPSTVSSNWSACARCGAWYLSGTGAVHTCVSASLVASPLERRIPHKCPCCDGYGEREKRGVVSDTATEPCKSCGGRGIIFE